MSWKEKVDGIFRRRELALELGGAEAIERIHTQGRLTVRERVDALVDRDSFREYGRVAGQSESDEEGRLTGFTAANAVVGTALVEDRRVVVCGDDFTIRGAAYSAVGLKKGQFAEQLSIQRKLPLLRLLDSGGASITGATATKGRSGYDLTSPSAMNVQSQSTLSIVPVVCAALGPVAGFPAAQLVASHFSIMTRDTSQVLTGGPALVARAIREKTTKEALGSSKVHGRSGVVDNVAEDEADVWRQIRRFLGYLPTSVWQLPPVIETDDPRDRRDEDLLSIIPENRRRAYKIRRVIEAIVDRGSFFEKTPGYGRSQVTGFARMNGQPVGIFANDCFHDGGSMTATGAQKVRRFVELCDTFHLPVLSLVDEPGFMIGEAAERAGTIRYGMEALFAASQTSVPWIAIVLRRAFGVALGIHLGPGATVLAWPSAEVGALPVEAGVSLAFRREIEAADDPDARRREIEDEFGAAQSIFPRAEEFGVHDLIDPRETRPAICDWLDEIRPSLATRSGPRAYSIRP